MQQYILENQKLGLFVTGKINFRHKLSLAVAEWLEYMTCA